jgi:hypothetical protein
MSYQEMWNGLECADTSDVSTSSAVTLLEKRCSVAHCANEKFSNTALSKTVLFISTNFRRPTACE